MAKKAMINKRSRELPSIPPELTTDARSAADRTLI